MYQGLVTQAQGLPVQVQLPFQANLHGQQLRTGSFFSKQRRKLGFSAVPSSTTRQCPNPRKFHGARIAEWAVHSQPFQTIFRRKHRFTQVQPFLPKMLAVGKLGAIVIRKRYGGVRALLMTTQGDRGQLEWQTRSLRLWHLPQNLRRVACQTSRKQQLNMGKNDRAGAQLCTQVTQEFKGLRVAPKTHEQPDMLQRERLVEGMNLNGLR